MNHTHNVSIKGDMPNSSYFFQTEFFELFVQYLCAFKCCDHYESEKRGNFCLCFNSGVAFMIINCTENQNNEIAVYFVIDGIKFHINLSFDV